MSEDFDKIGQRAKVRSAALSPIDQRNKMLLTIAAELRSQRDFILESNDADVEAAPQLTEAQLDRLTLTQDRVESMAKSVEEIAALPDPLDRILWETTRPNGLHIQRVSAPLGVIGVIFESRPNVCVDAAALCVKSGNAVILRGGSESFRTNQALMRIINGVLGPSALAQMAPTTDRSFVDWMLQADKYIDVIIPRGGKSLVERVKEKSKVPVFAHLEGICHTYVDRQADLEMAKNIVLNAKMRRPGVCGATETLLIDLAKADKFAPSLIEALLESGCEVRADADIVAKYYEGDKRLKIATEKDFHTEYLDAIISVKLVDGVSDALWHIHTYGSQHTDAIVTKNPETAEKFLKHCNSAICLWNASTQFADGGEFGMGAEIGIATGKLHARGPVGVEQLCGFKYVVRGEGQTRP